MTQWSMQMAKTPAQIMQDEFRNRHAQATLSTQAPAGSVAMGGDSYMNAYGKVAPPPVAQPNNVNNLATPYGMGGVGVPATTLPQTGGTGGASQMPTDMMTMYKNFLQNPGDVQDNPAMKAMMDSGLQAAERGMLAKGFQGSGNMATELQKTGMGIAAQQIPTMASMYGAGAQTEADRYGIENRAELGQGQLGLNTWQAQAADQLARARANYGMQQDTKAQDMYTQSQSQFAPLMNMMSMQAMQGY